MVNASLSLWRLTKVSGFSARVVHDFAKPVLCALGAVAVLRLLNLGALPLGWGTFIVSAVLALAVYILLLVGTGTVSREDIKWARGAARASGA